MFLPKPSHTLRLFCTASLFLGSGGVFAGEIVLTNGDSVKGKFKSIDKTSVVWVSENFGTLTIPKNKVAKLSVDQKVVIQGQKDPCELNGLDGNYLTYECGNSGYTERTELMTLASILPFQEGVAPNRSLTGNVSVAGQFYRGNTIKDDLDADVDVTFRDGDYRHQVTAEYEALSSNDLPADEDYEGEYRLDWFFDEQWYWYNSANAGAEESANIQERYQLGTGLGVQMWENINTALALESGVDYIKEHYDPDDDTGEEQEGTEGAAWRFATDFRYKLPFSASLVHSNEVLYSLEDGEDWELSADLGLSVPLGPGLFSEYKVEYDYDNLPADGAKRDDTQFTIGIGYEW